MNENEIREQTQSLINAYREISCRDTQSLSISDFLMLRNQAVNELDHGIKSCITAIPSPVTSMTRFVPEEEKKTGAKRNTDSESAEHTKSPPEKSVSEKGISNERNSLNKRTNDTNLNIPKTKSNFEILQQIKDEWNS